MTLAELRQFPTVIGTGPNGARIHESVMRSYQMLLKVQELLQQRPPVPHDIILEMIEDVMDATGVTKETGVVSDFS